MWNEWIQMEMKTSYLITYTSREGDDNGDDGYQCTVML